MRCEAFRGKINENTTLWWENVKDRFQDLKGIQCKIALKNTTSFQMERIFSEDDVWVFSFSSWGVLICFGQENVFQHFGFDKRTKDGNTGSPVVQTPCSLLGFGILQSFDIFCWKQRHVQKQPPFPRICKHPKPRSKSNVKNLGT